MAPKTEDVDASATSHTTKPAYRYDIVLWMFGMLFLAALMAFIFSIGDCLLLLFVVLP